MVHRVEFVDIHRQTAATSGIAESLFAETTDFSHYIRRVMMVDHIDFIVTLVSVP